MDDKGNVVNGPDEGGLLNSYDEGDQAAAYLYPFVRSVNDNAARMNIGMQNLYLRRDGKLTIDGKTSSNDNTLIDKTLIPPIDIRP